MRERQDEEEEVRRQHFTPDSANCKKNKLKSSLCIASIQILPYLEDYIDVLVQAVSYSHFLLHLRPHCNHTILQRSRD